MSKAELQEEKLTYTLLLVWSRWWHQNGDTLSQNPRTRTRGERREGEEGEGVWE